MRELNNDDNGDHNGSLELDRSESRKRLSISNQFESFNPTSEAVNLQACYEASTNQPDIVFENRTVGTDVNDRLPDSLDLEILDHVRPAVARILLLISAAHHHLLNRFPGLRFLEGCPSGNGEE